MTETELAFPNSIKENLLRKTLDHQELAYDYRLHLIIKTIENEQALALVDTAFRTVFVHKTKEGFIVVNDILPRDSSIIDSPKRAEHKGTDIFLDITNLTKSSPNSLIDLTHEIGHILNLFPDCPYPIPPHKVNPNVKKRTDRYYTDTLESEADHIQYLLDLSYSRVYIFEPNAWTTAKPLTDLLDIPKDIFQTVRKKSLRSYEIKMLVRLWEQLIETMEETDLKNSNITLLVPNLIDNQETQIVVKDIPGILDDYEMQESQIIQELTQLTGMPYKKPSIQ